MGSQTIENGATNLGLFLVFGLLAGMLLNQSALGVLGGLFGHLVINSIYHRVIRIKQDVKPNNTYAIAYVLL
jgi:hypothetical protein